MPRRYRIFGFAAFSLRVRSERQAEAGVPVTGRAENTGSGTGSAARKGGMPEKAGVAKDLRGSAGEGDQPVEAPGIRKRRGFLLRSEPGLGIRQ